MKPDNKKENDLDIKELSEEELSAAAGGVNTLVNEKGRYYRCSSGYGCESEETELSQINVNGKDTRAQRSLTTYNQMRCNNEKQNQG